MTAPRVPPRRSREGGDGQSNVENRGDRLQRIEASIQHIQETLDVQFRRIAAMQAELDLLRMKQKGG
jgi:hypothetical protein